jgi:hypothetical protein
MHARSIFFALVSAGALMAISRPATAGIPGGVAIVLGFHIVPQDDTENYPWPPAPEDLVSHATEAGLYDVWLFLHTRSPLIGAWYMKAGLDYSGDSGKGVDVLDWKSFTDSFVPFMGWPGSGAAFRAAWRRERCWNPETFMRRGRNGWWVQPVLRLRVQVHGPDRILFSDPEPGVPPQLTECADEMHELDGTDSWSRVIPAVFGNAPLDGSPGRSATLVQPGTWGSLKNGRRP